MVSRADAAGAAVVGYAPRSVSAGAAGFARETVARVAPPSPGRAKALLFACSRLAAFGERVGLALSGEVLLSEAVIERFVLVGCEGLASASVRTLRTNLRWLARSLGRYPEPAPTPLPRERAKRPYTEAEIDGFLRLAGALSTRRRRVRAGALVCLGAGAGVIAGELRHVRGTDVVDRCGGVLVLIDGRRGRYRSWPATSSHCSRPPRSPASSSSSGGGSRDGATSPTSCARFCRSIARCPGWRAGGSDPPG